MEIRRKTEPQGELSNKIGALEKDIMLKNSK